jgi:hypothetical protein
MGLNLQIGYWGLSEPDAWLDSQLFTINAVLKDHKFPNWNEPRSPLLERSRTETISYPYSWLDALRAAYLSRKYDPNWVATEVEELEDHLEVDSHLLNHSDCEGFYLPVDCEDFIIDDRVPGGILGSSYRLFEELSSVAPALGIKLENGVLSDEEAHRINELINSCSSDIEPMLTVWLSFYEAARLSVKYGRILILC